MKNERESLEKLILQQCEKLLSSEFARQFPQEAKALVLISWTYGAAWALERPDMVEFGNAQFDALRKNLQ